MSYKVQSEAICEVLGHKAADRAKDEVAGGPAGTEQTRRRTFLKANNASSDFELQNELNPQFGIKKLELFRLWVFLQAGEHNRVELRGCYDSVMSYKDMSSVDRLEIKSSEASRLRGDLPIQKKTVGNILEFFSVF